MLSIASQITRSSLHNSGSLLRVSAALPTAVSALSNHDTQLNHAPIETQPQQQQIRWKHSERQIKRLFRKHPAIRRVEQREGVDRTPTPMPPPQFEGTAFAPTFLPNGWSAPPGPEFSLPEYPFAVARTKNKPNDAAGFLPVYSTFRKDGSKPTTRVKKVTGNRDLFIQELRSILALPPPKNGDVRVDPIRVRVGGTIEIKGNRTGDVTRWLAGLGF